MPNVIEASDPRGYPVICTEDTWNYHILPRHSNLTGREAEVKQAIEHPAFITQDATRSERNIYFRFTSGKARLLYLKVVVSFENNQGTVITAFLTDSGKTGETIIWTGSSA